MATRANKNAVKEAAIARLRAMGAACEKREDKWGETKAGWWLDGVWLARVSDPVGALSAADPADYLSDDEWAAAHWHADENDTTTDPLIAVWAAIDHAFDPAAILAAERDGDPDDDESDPADWPDWTGEVRYRTTR